MGDDFSQPQRQSIVGIFVMFVYSLQGYAKAFWPILVIWIFKFDEINKGYLLAGTVAVFAVIGIVAYLRYRNFTFYIDSENDEFIITEGVFNKTKTAIQLHKIQQVNINQSFVQRMVGVYELAVDTAGSNKKEGDIKAISHVLALDLKARLLENEKKVEVENLDSVSTVVSTERVVDADIPFIKISFLSLLKIGITSNYVKSFFVLLAFFITLFDYIKQITGRDILHDGNIEDYVAKSQVAYAFLMLFIVFFLAVIVINLVKTVFTYFDYKIARQKGSLLLSFGLLNTRSTIVKPEKVQITSVRQNFFQKKMNVLELKIKQATSGEKEERKSAIEIPGCDKLEKDAILKLLFQKIPEKGVMLKPNFRKLGFSVFLSIGLPLLAFYFVRDLVVTQMPMIDYLAAFFVVFMGLIQFFIFKNNRLFINDDFIILQSGAWDVSNEIIEPSKIQAITVSQLFWHKNINIGSLTLHTAGGNIAFQLGNFTAIKQYVNLWLYEIETSDSNWM
ncbi:PH domain-containing protein [Flavobacterium sp. ZT3R18]|uniref:PH domain-containing protein n=1 Tax=Flavobacterium sp. ZT3R18 TaxID=2594429 RepID=UPI00117ADDEF|nr:PH domain-containing protein [Flavobacterium sp. ZT3R18]TRX31875.1 PH domain-containing protein [Flavobacterium sp. ZT3R18]